MNSKSSLNTSHSHQANLRAYDNTNSILGDLVKATLTKYSHRYKLPIKSPSQHDSGILMTARMAYNASGANAQLRLGSSSIRLKTVNAAKVPLTGISYGTAKETYGGQTISTVNMSANGTVTIPAPAW